MTSWRELSIMKSINLKNNDFNILNVMLSFLKRLNIYISNEKNVKIRVSLKLDLCYEFFFKLSGQSKFTCF